MKKKIVFHPRVHTKQPSFQKKGNRGTIEQVFLCTNVVHHLKGIEVTKCWQGLLIILPTFSLFLGFSMGGNNFSLFCNLHFLATKPFFFTFFLRSTKTPLIMSILAEGVSGFCYSAVLLCCKKK